MAQYDREYFEKQFEGLSVKARAIVALRAAMRVLPILAYRATPFAYWKNERAKHALAIIRCCQASTFVNGLTEVDDAVAVALSAARSAAQKAGWAIDARFSGYHVTSSAADAVYLAASNGAAESAIRSAYAARWWPFDSSFIGEIAADVGQVKAGDGSPKVHLLSSRLWSDTVFPRLASLITGWKSRLRELDAGFDIWIDWYQDRLDGKPFDWEIERQWALLQETRLAQSPAEINAYLKGLRERALTKQLKRVRAIFIGHGEAGKTSLRAIANFW